MTFTGATPISTDPALLTFGAAEAWTVGVDVTKYLASYPPGTTPTNPRFVLTAAHSPTPIPLPDPPTVAGNVISQHIAAAKVAAGSSYQLIMTFTPSGTTDILEAVVVLQVPLQS